MQTRDHLALGRYLLDQSGSGQLHRHARAFLFGCIEPDCNIATYMRRHSGSGIFKGHFTENSAADIGKRLSAFQENGVYTAWDYFSLGAVLHYVADAFTLPHNDFWQEGLYKHAVYEAKLHKVLFSEDRAFECSVPRFPCDYFNDMHAEYTDAPHRTETDCRYIFRACAGVLAGCLACVPHFGARYESEGGASLEGAYRHGLV